MEQVSSKYSAAKSLGWLWLFLLAMTCFGLAVLVLVTVVKQGTGMGALGVLAAAAAIIAGLYVLVLAGWSNTVRYEMTPEKIIMFCGPVRYNIPIKDVVNVTTVSLARTGWSGMRLPGFSLGRMPYKGVGDVIMCSTRSSRGVILVETGSKKYGMSPADETAFFAELQGYIESR